MRWVLLRKLQLCAVETLLDEPVRMFAYPNGVPQQDFGAEHVGLARQCGFLGAVTTAWGTASMASVRMVSMHRLSRSRLPAVGVASSREMTASDIIGTS